MGMCNKKYLLNDALMDCLRGVNELTDMEHPPVDKICGLACAIKDFQKTLYYMHQCGDDGEMIEMAEAAPKK